MLGLDHACTSMRAEDARNITLSPRAARVVRGEAIAPRKSKPILLTRHHRGRFTSHIP